MAISNLSNVRGFIHEEKKAVYCTIFEKSNLTNRSQYVLFRKNARIVQKRCLLA